MRSVTIFFVCFLIGIQDYAAAGQGDDQQASLEQFYKIHSLLFDTEVSNLNQSEVELSIREALEILDKNQSYIATLHDESLTEKASTLQNLLEMSKDLGCESISLSERFMVSTKNSRFPQIKQYLDLHLERQLQQCNDDLEDSVKHVTDDTIRTELIDKIKTDIQLQIDASGRKKILLLDVNYVAKIMKSISRMLTNEPYVQMLQRRPDQTSVIDYRYEFDQKILHLFSPECAPFEKVGMYNLLKRYQDYQGTLMDLGAISTLQKISPKTLDWLQKRLICLTFNVRLAEFWSPFLWAVYDPIKMMHELSENTSFLEINQIDGDLKFIKYVVNQVKPNTGAIARLSHRLDIYMALMRSEQIRNCNLDQVYEILRLRDLDSKSLNLIIFFRSHLLSYLIHCFDNLDRHVRTNVLPRVPKLELDRTDGLRRSIASAANVNRAAQIQQVSDDAIFEGAANFLVCAQGKTKIKFDQLYEDNITGPCAILLSHLGTLFGDIDEIATLTGSPASYIKGTISDLRTTLAICKKIAYNDEAFSLIDEKLRTKTKKSSSWNLNFACIGNSKQTLE